MRIRKARLVGKDSSRGVGRKARRKIAMGEDDAFQLGLSHAEEGTAPLDEDDFELISEFWAYEEGYEAGESQDADALGPQDEDYVIRDNPRGGYEVYQVGYRNYGHFSDRDEAVDFITNDMQQNNVYSSVFFESDHGNTTLLEDFNYPNRSARRRNSRKSSARAGTPRMKLVSRNRADRLNRGRRLAVDDDSPDPVEENISTLYGFEDDTGSEAEFEEPTFEETGEPEMKPEADDPVPTHEENTAPSIEEMRSGNEMREHNGPFLDEDKGTPDLTNEDGTNRTTGRRRRSNRIKVKSREPQGKRAGGREARREDTKIASADSSAKTASAAKPDGEDYQRRMQLGMELSDLRIEAGLIPADARWNEVYRLAENHTADEIGHRLAEDRELVGKVASKVAANANAKQTKAASGTPRATQRVVPNLAGLGNAPRREEPQVSEVAAIFGG